MSKELILERLNKLNATKGGSPNLLPHFDRFMGEKKMHEVSYTYDFLLNPTTILEPFFKDGCHI